MASALGVARATLEEATDRTRRRPAAGGEGTIDSEPGAGTRIRFPVPTALEPPLR
jgi:hypothetical protein